MKEKQPIMQLLSSQTKENWLSKAVCMNACRQEGNIIFLKVWFNTLTYVTCKGYTNTKLFKYIGLMTAATSLLNKDESYNAFDNLFDK